MKFDLEIWVWVFFSNEQHSLIQVPNSSSMWTYHCKSVKFLFLCCSCTILFRFLCAVFRTSISSTHDALTVKSSSDHLVSHTRTISDTTTPHQHNRMFLQIVALARNMDEHDFTSSQTNTSDFTLSRVWFLWFHGKEFEADSASLGASVKSGGSRLFDFGLSAATNDLSESSESSSSRGGEGGRE